MSPRKFNTYSCGNLSWANELLNGLVVPYGPVLPARENRQGTLGARASGAAGVASEASASEPAGLGGSSGLLSVQEGLPQSL